MTGPPVLRPPRGLARRVVAAQGSRAYRTGLVWVVIGTPLSLVFLVSILLGLALGTVLSPMFLGLVLLAGVMAYARGLGGLHRRLAGSLLGTRVAEPMPAPLAPGLWNWIKARVGDPIGWRAIAYLVLRVPLALVDLVFVGTLLVYGIATTTYPFFWFTTGGRVMPLFDLLVENWVLTLPLAAFGILMLLAMPWVVNGVVTIDRLLVRGLLGPTALAERVRDLEESRASAVDDATVRLRRIERDLHDGAQAQLVALAMKLGIAKDDLDTGTADVDQVRALVTAAHANAKQALAELRDLARGIHPAALDAGLDVALSTLVSTTGIDARLSVDLPTRPSPSIETIAYFTVAELLTNAAKHAARPIGVEVGSAGGVLRLVVRDGGPGGARVAAGGGLAGLVERLRTVDGGLAVSSPHGGPTAMTVTIPLSG
ncbi:sensor histidine kinase [Amycolatopsis sp. H20-H5]|uniref:sensor histidine kinase n=1 Tax=Amycolatopsis sp. H20-H5 TaxID=3046309 RepID=UPI002DB56DD9|nr:sensor domain-containing protein [Amycolatopsis sp. H20-H5]MEC3979767.1 sensor domain-containing protein [Amycolatopsis sp. H20-H5]